MNKHHTFRNVKDSTLQPSVRRVAGNRTGMISAGNPDVLKEAEGKEDHAKGGLKEICEAYRQASPIDASFILTAMGPNGS